MQAVLSGFIGYVLGMALALLAIRGAQDTKLTIIMTPELAVGLFLVTIGMCVFAAISAIMKVVRIDPAVVFSR
jgi:putative ABC transport system permease protein